MARYIDADALKLDIDLSKGATVLDMALSVIKAVQEAPTADVAEVKHGEWKIIADYKESEVAQCTHCKEDFWYMKQGQLQIKHMPYCPECGAKMDGNI